MDTKLEFLFFHKYNKEEYNDFHKHHCFELVYYINGKGNTTIDDEKFTFTNNTFSFMPINSNHDRSFIEDTDLISIAFLFNLPIEIKGGVYKDVDGKILSYMEEIKHEFLSKKSHYQLRLNTLIVQILVELDRSINGDKPSNENDCFNYIKNYIDVHYNEKIDLQSLAALSFYSYDHFRHKFKEYFGLAPKQYVVKKRVEGAVEMLKRTDSSISEIAMNCGFSTVAQFCLLFKKHTSKTPAEYQREIL